MKFSSVFASAGVAFVLFLAACNNETNQTTETNVPKLKEETISYKVDSLNMSSYLVYDENKEGQRPAVLVVHE